jgi:hypothetical protein
MFVSDFDLSWAGKRSIRSKFFGGDEVLAVGRSRQLDGSANDQ